MKYPIITLTAAALLSAPLSTLARPQAHLWLNEVPLVADSTAGKIYVSLEPEACDALQATLRWDDTEIKGVKLNTTDLTNKEGNFTLDNWTAGENTLTVTTNKETRTWTVVFTTLPLVVIDITQAELWSLRQETDEDTKHPSYITFIDPRFRTEGQTEFGSKVMMRVRGVTSAGKPKKSFAVELVDDNGEEKDIHLFGYRNDGDWILDAMYNDYSRMRNRLNFDLWNAVDDLPYDKDNRYQANGTHGEFVEVFMAGQYHGLYCFTDKIDRKKLNLKKTKEATATTAEKTRGLLWKAKFRCSATTLSKYDAYPTNDTLVWEKYWEQKYPDDRQDQAYFNPIADAIDSVGRSASDKEAAAHWENVFYADNMLDYIIFSQAFQWMDNLQKNYYFSVRNLTKDKKILFTPWDLDATIGRSAGGEELTDDKKWYAFGEQLGGINYFVWRMKHKQPEGFATRLNNRWQYLKTHALSLDSVRSRMQAYADLFNRSGAWQREKAFCDELRKEGAKMTATPEEEIEFMMNFLKLNYAAFDEKVAAMNPDAYTEPTPKVKPALYVVGPDKEIAFEGNEATIGGSVTRLNVDSIASIDYADGKMTVNFEESSQVYDVAGVKEVRTSTDKLYTAHNFIPEAYKETFNFDTRYSHPSYGDTTAYVKPDAFAVQRTIRFDYDTDTVKVIGNLHGLTVSREGMNVTIASPYSGMHYVFSGNAAASHVILQGSNAAKISMDNASLGATVVESQISAPVMLVMKPNTHNTLASVSAASSLVVTGEGELQLVGEADNQHALSTPTDLTVEGGVINIYTSGKDAKGLMADNLTIEGGNIHVITTGESSVSGDYLGEEGSHGLLAKTQATVKGGRLTVKTLGENGGSGIASLGKFEMTGGHVALACFDDPVSAEKSITISGGELFTSSLVDDGMDSKGSISVEGGTVYVVGSYPNEGAFDNNGKTFAAKGGVIIGIGAKSDAPQSSKSTQACVVVKKSEGFNRYVRLSDEAGLPILTFETPAYEKTTLVLSAPSLERGKSYTLSTSQTETGEYTTVTTVTAQ